MQNNYVGAHTSLVQFHSVKDRQQAECLLDGYCLGMRSAGVDAETGSGLYAYAANVMRLLFPQ